MVNEWHHFESVSIWTSCTARNFQGSWHLAIEPDTQRNFLFVSVTKEPPAGYHSKLCPIILLFNFLSVNVIWKQSPGISAANFMSRRNYLCMFTYQKQFDMLGCSVTHKHNTIKWLMHTSLFFLLLSSPSHLVNASSPSSLPSFKSSAHNRCVHSNQEMDTEISELCCCSCWICDHCSLRSQSVVGWTGLLHLKCSML